MFFSCTHSYFVLSLIEYLPQVICLLLYHCFVYSNYLTINLLLLSEVRIWDHRGDKRRSNSADYPVTDLYIYLLVSWIYKTIRSLHQT